jgi:hypothetical protein
MKVNEGLCEDEICDSRQQQDYAVHSNRPRVEVILAHPSGREWNERQPEEQVQVRPQSRTVDALSCVQQVVMVVPVDADVNETQDVTQEDGNHWR